jgi:hypothetical protein
MVTVAPIITGISFILYFPHTLYFYCKVFVFYNFFIFLITFQSPEISLSIHIRVLFSLSRIHYHHQHHHYPHSLLHNILACSQNSTVLTDRALPSHSSTENILTLQHVLSIAAFCFRIYRLGLKHSCNLFVITHTVDSTPF